MKKFLLVLAVVALASFLFVGCLPNVPVTVTGVTLDQATMTLTAGGATGTLVATVAPATAANKSVTWSSSTSAVATVANGVVTPLTAGTTTITVTTVDGGLTATCAVTVETSPPPSADITIAVATETLPDADGKIFVKGGSREIIVTFPDVVENPVVKVGTAVVPVFTLDDKVFKGTGTFVGDAAVLIEVSGVCDSDLCAAKSVVVDSSKPYAEVKAEAEECACEDSYALTITSDWEECIGCAADPGCCKDKGSGLASWNVKIFDEDPWKVPDVDECVDPEECPPCCTDDPCVDPIAELDGTACPITITTECIEPEFVWDDVAGNFVKKTYFDKFYYVIVTLTDNVDNKTTYLGIVQPYPYEPMNYVYNFREIIHPDPDDAQMCWCWGESLATADSVLGDCDGTPATECWEFEPELDPCPIVILFSEEVEEWDYAHPNQEPLTAVQGQKYYIGIDYWDAEKPECFPAAYIGPAIKGFATGIPDDAQELTLVEYEEDMFYVGPYTFGQAGTDYIYVTDCCEDCTPCKYAVEVLPAECPEILIAGEVLYLGDWYVDEDDHVITVTFDVPTDGVRVFTSDLATLWLGSEIPALAVEIDMTTTDNKVFTGTGAFDGACDTEWIYVLIGDCCEVVCSRTVTVDGLTPYAELIAEVEDCGDACDPGNSVIITSDGFNPADDCDALCCGDACTALGDWTLSVYDTQPFATADCPPCVPAAPCVEPIKVCSDSECDIECDVFGCVLDPAWAATVGTYYVVFTKADLVGNAETTYGILVIAGTSAVPIAELNDATLSTTTCELTSSTTDDIMGDCVGGTPE